MLNYPNIYLYDEGYLEDEYKKGVMYLWINMKETN
jgi:hypothetical protein